MLNAVFNKAILVLLGLLVSAIAFAEIYRWQDTNGRWHFSDTPVDEQGNLIVEVSREEDNPVRQEHLEETELTPEKFKSNNLAIQLENKYSPSSDIERVTLSVVAIETHMGSGSGFFISEQGHLVTNKHVVRPMEHTAFEDAKSKFEEAKQKISERRRKFKEEERLLKEFKQELDDYKAQIGQRSVSSSKVADAEYKEYLLRYEQRLDRYKRTKRRFDKSVRAHEKQVSDFEWRVALAKSARQFKVFLKDDVEYTGQLITLSDDLDLALLKLEKYHTPFLEIGTASNVKQGLPVFAVGSPLGMRDSITSGIVTRTSGRYLVTDAKILPGNSGGPLVDKEGRVIGVNTLKFGITANSDGFGFAIPIDEVFKEFKQHLPKKN